MSAKTDTEFFVPWSARRLSLVARDLKEIASLTSVGNEGKELLAKASEYIEALGWQTTAQLARAQGNADRKRANAYNHKVRGKPGAA